MASKPEKTAKPLFAREQGAARPLFADAAVSVTATPAALATDEFNRCGAGAQESEPAPDVRRVAVVPQRPAAPRARALVLPEPVLPAAVSCAAAAMVFGDGTESPLERLKRAAVASLPQMPPGQSALLEETIRELLPPDSGRLAACGNALLRSTEAMTNELQQLTAAVASWRAGELIEDCEQAMGASGLWRMFRRSPSLHKPAFEFILQQVTPTLAALERLADRLPLCRDRFAVLLLLLKLAPQVLSLHAVDAETILRRSHLLALSAQQFELLATQIEQLRRQVIAWQSAIEQLLRVAIPVWELANARAAR